MSADTITIGYPVHALARWAAWTNPHGANFVDWAAHCGQTGTATGHDPFGRAGSARKAELCRVCFPDGHRTVRERPVRVDRDD